jgi:hypothetical protein
MQFVNTGGYLPSRRAESWRLSRLPRLCFYYTFSTFYSFHLPHIPGYRTAGGRDKLRHNRHRLGWSCTRKPIADNINKLGLRTMCPQEDEF